VVISGVEMVYRIVELPVLPEAEIAETIHYQTAKMVPYLPKDLVVDYYKLNTPAAEKKQMYFVAAVSEKDILDRLAAVDRVGIKPKAILAPASALGSLLGKKKSGNLALIDLGSSATMIVLISQGQVVFAREIKVGGADITRAMVGVVQTGQGKTELNANNAEELKNAFGIPLNVEEYTKEAGVPGSEIMGLIRPVLENIAAEILNTFAYYRKEMQVEVDFNKVYFTGGASQIKNLIAYYKNQLNLEVEALPCFCEVKPDKKDFHQLAPSFCVAVGAVLPGKEILKFKVALPTRSELAPKLGLKESLKQVSSFSFIILAYMFALMVLFIWFTGQESRLGSTRNALDAELVALQNPLRPKPIIVVQPSVEVKAIVAPDVDTDYFVKVINTVNAINLKNVYLTGASFNRSSGEFTISGLGQGEEGLTKIPLFTNQLEKSGLFKKVVSSSLTETKEETDLGEITNYNFTIKCVLAGAEKK